MADAEQGWSRRYQPSSWISVIILTATTMLCLFAVACDDGEGPAEYAGEPTQETTAGVSPPGASSTPSATASLTTTATPTLPVEATAKESPLSDTPAATAEASTVVTIESATPEAGPVTPGSSPSPDVDEGLRPLIDDAVADLAARLEMDSDDVRVIAAFLVAWPNASFGCPEPGMVYLQVPEDGAVMELRAGSTTYYYHVGGWRDPFLCESEERLVPPRI